MYVQAHVCVRVTVHVRGGEENRLLSLCVSACRRCVRGDGATAREVCVCWHMQSSRLRFCTRTCAREGEQAADKCASVRVCQSGCAWGFAGQGCTGACKHQTPSWVPAPEARRPLGCPGCAARGERGHLRAGLSLESSLGWQGLAEPGWAGRAAELRVGLLEPLCSVSPHRCRKLYWTDGDNISVANMDGSNRTLLFTNQKGPVGTDAPCPPSTTPPCGALAVPKSLKPPLWQHWLPKGLAAGLC